jgi:glycosyltransferase involved in cell wall biosynthesis
MLVSVIICTYRRVDATRDVLGCLAAQAFRDFEVLVIDGSGEGSPEREALQQITAGFENQMNVWFLPSRKGLTVQRNLGLERAGGELIFFLDDDVTFSPEFLGRAAELFSRPDMQDVGGASGYDVRNYPQEPNLRWRVRSALGVVPHLDPGRIDRLGRSVPVSFMKPFAGCRDMGYLYGFCMLFRKQAIGDLRFDEILPTYGGEDRDFSSRVGKNWRLVLSGDLQLEHHSVPQSRDSGVQRTFQAGFGIGRGFGKNASRKLDYLELARQIVCEFALDSVACLQRPSRDRFVTPFARAMGFLAGLRSFHRHAGEIL